METTVHTASGQDITFEEGTDVVVQRGGVLEFKGTPFTGFKVDEGEYRINVAGSVQKVVFPDGVDEQAPFPWLLLDI
jgi:hypothetical protein